MKRLIIISIVCFFTFSSLAPANGNTGDKKFASLLPTASAEGSGVSEWVDSVYNKLDLNTLGLQKNVFFYACKGYQYLLNSKQLQKTALLTICDYTQSSTHKRLYVIDIEKGAVLYNTYVSHGKNSGSEFATSFSNKLESHKSSLGFMITSNTYLGKAGYSMCFDGLEKGINSNVKSRAIVMHGSNYVDEDRAATNNGMGRSFGCPAVPYSDHRKIIDAIKGGSCFFSYADDKWYISTSKILTAKFSWPSVNTANPSLQNIASSFTEQAPQLSTSAGL